MRKGGAIPPRQARVKLSTPYSTSFYHQHHKHSHHHQTCPPHHTHTHNVVLHALPPRHRRLGQRCPLLQHHVAPLRRQDHHHWQPRRHPRDPPDQLRPRARALRRRQQCRAQGESPDQLVPHHQLLRGSPPGLHAEPSQGVRQNNCPTPPSPNTTGHYNE